MIFGDWLRAPRRLRLVFISVMLLLSAALGGLAWRILDQDRQVAQQRLAEQRDTAADLVTAALEKRLIGIEQDLDRIFSVPETVRPSPLPEGAVYVQFAGESVQTWPRNRLIFYPEYPEQPEIPPGIFSTADELEFKKSDYAAAIAAARTLAASESPMVRAEALARLARNCAKAGRSRESVEAYRRLADLGSVPVGGMPAALAASFAILNQQTDPAARLAAARFLHRDLHSARWQRKVRRKAVSSAPC